MEVMAIRLFFILLLLYAVLVRIRFYEYTSVYAVHCLRVNAESFVKGR